jgi:hypothetical protein
LRHPLSKSNPSGDVKGHFNFPEDDSTLDVLYAALQQQIQVCSYSSVQKYKINSLEATVCSLCIF